MKKTILVTGASSFLGHHVMPLLQRSSHMFEILAPTSKELNLLDRGAVINYICSNKPDIILHMAALCGGIGANKAAPAEFAHDNLKMSVNLFDGIRRVNRWGREYDKPAEKPTVTHFYGLGTVCAYPKNCPVPFKEDDMWNGFPEETNAPYGNAKRMMLVLQQSFKQQFGLKGAHLIPVNLYGEWDHFNLESSHVMPALINKFITAKESENDSVEVWGDGTPTREFLYAGDCAIAIVKAIVTGFDHTEPINIGTGEDISIKDLADLIRKVVNFNGKVKFTGEVSVNGQPKRRLDVSRAEDVLGFKAKTDLITGIEKTVAWYKKSKANPIKEVMNAESRSQSEALSKLNRIIILLEKSTEEVFDQISRNSQDTRMDATINRYLNLLTLTLERAQALRNNEIKSEILTDMKPGFHFIKATPISERTARMRELVKMQDIIKEIRDSVDDPDLLRSIAERVDSIKPNLDTITEDNKEFLLGLISRAHLASKPKLDKLNVDSPLNVLDINTLQKKVEDSNSVVCEYNGNVSIRSSKPIVYESSNELKKFNESRNHNGVVNPVDLLVRAGLDRNVAEQRVRDNLGIRSDRAEVLKALGISDGGVSSFGSKNLAKTPDPIHQQSLEIHQQSLQKLADKINAIKDDTVNEKPKYNTVRRLDPKSYSHDDLYQRISKCGDATIEPRTLESYEQIERTKTDNAQRAVVGEGPGMFRRTGNQNVKLSVKKLSEHEKEFMEAADAFSEEYGLSVSDLKRNKRGKRLPDGNFLHSGISVTDTEIMASKTLNDRNIACPKRLEAEKKQKKVEKKKKPTLFGTAKKLVSSIVEIIKNK